MRPVASLLLVGLGSLGACSSSGDTIDTPHRATTTPTPKPDAAVSTPDGGAVVAPVDAATGGSATTYVGTLDVTPSTRFGGGPAHCTYDVALKNVTIELAVTPAGEVIGGTVKDLMVETIAGTCAYAAQAPAEQSFSFQTATGTQLTWVGAVDNHPKTSLVIDITKTGASYQAAATWERTDLTDDLKWVVKTKITLGPR